MGRCGWPNYLQEPWHPSPCGNSSPHLQSRPDGSFQPHAHGSVAPGQLLRMILAASYILIHGRTEQVSCGLHQAHERHLARYQGNVDIRHYYYTNLLPTKLTVIWRYLAPNNRFQQSMTPSLVIQERYETMQPLKIQTLDKKEAGKHRSHCDSPHKLGRETRPYQPTSAISYLVASVRGYMRTA